jgi:hypothetical protein
MEREKDGTMSFSDETLMAYADGELDETTRLRSKRPCVWTAGWSAGWRACAPRG